MSRKFMVLGRGLIVGVLALAVSGCMTYPISLSGTSTYIGGNDRVTEIGPASGSAFGGVVFGLPIGEPNQVGNALKRALKSSGGDALIEVKVEYKIYNLMIGTLMRTKVYGTAVKVRKRGG